MSSNTPKFHVLLDGEAGIYLQIRHGSSGSLNQFQSHGSSHESLEEAKRAARKLIHETCRGNFNGKCAAMGALNKITFPFFTETGKRTAYQHIELKP